MGRKLGNNKFHNAAHKFKRKVTESMREVIEANTDYEVKFTMESPKLVLYGESPDRSNIMVDARDDGGRDRTIKKLEETWLVYAPFYSNVTEVGEDDNSAWWKYNVAFITMAEDYVKVMESVKRANYEAIVNGEFLSRLKKKYQRVVGVSIPGQEKLSISLSPLRDDDVLNEDMWNIYQWIGLGLFSLTFIAMITLNRTAQRRLKRVKEQENWGVGLATEQDINKLLTYGWECHGNQVRTFDKSKMIYRDDDSMLIGGMFVDDAVSPINGIGGAPTEAVTTERECPTERSPSNIDSSAVQSSGAGTNSIETTATPDVEQH